MKKFWAVLSTAVLTFTALVSFSTPAKADTMDVLGATVTWDASMLYEPTACSSFNFNYNNGSGIRLLQMEFQIKSKFGDSIARESQIGINSGTSGTWRVQICRSALIDGLGPYKTEFTIEDYSGSSRMVTGSISFRSRSTGVAPSGAFKPVFPPANSRLEVLGATVEFDANSLFQPSGCSSFVFNYSNGTGIRLLQLEFQIKSKFGDSVVRESEIGIPAGNSGVWRAQICRSALTDGLGPYTTELSIEDYSGTVRSVTGQLTFVARTAKTPPFASSGGAAQPQPSNPTPAVTLPAMKSVSMAKVSNPGIPPVDLVALSPAIQNGVVTIFCAGGQGSGWSANVSFGDSFLSAGYKSYIITNHHVVEDCLSTGAVTVQNRAGSQFAGKVIAYDEPNDLAGIAIGTSVPGLDWQGETPAQGWWVGVIGTPKGQSGVLTTGILSRVNESTNILNLTAPLNPGNSGGPAFDRKGRVVGVVSAKYVDTEGFGIAQGTPLLCQKIVTCGSGTQGVWTTANLVVTEPAPEAQNPTGPAEPNVTSKTDKRTLAGFSGTKSTLTFTQQQQIAALVLANPNAQTMTCSAYRLSKASSSALTLAKKRATASCVYAKRLNPNLDTTIALVTTTVKSNIGKVLVTAKTTQ